MMKRRRLALPLTAALLVASSAWAQNTVTTPSGGSTSGNTNSNSGSDTSDMTIQTRTGSMGEYLTDGAGNTVYLFMADTSGKSSCTGSCAQVWKPLVASGGEHPQASGDANSSLIGVTSRTDGSSQVTYNDHPLYTYTLDTSPGQTNGDAMNSFSGMWYLVKPDGTPLMHSTGTTGTTGGSTSTTSSTGGGSG